jgi:hypothetical protein
MIYTSAVGAVMIARDFTRKRGRPERGLIEHLPIAIC